MIIASLPVKWRTDYRWILPFLVAVPVLAILVLVMNKPDMKRFKRAMSSPDQVYGVMREYGRPDRDESTEHEDPRPPLVIRQIEYRNIDVRLVFVPEAYLGDPPPYSGWKFTGSTGISNGQVLTQRELEARLARLPAVDHHPKNILSPVW